jgi:hypothetical protein
MGIRISEGTNPSGNGLDCPVMHSCNSTTAQALHMLTSVIGLKPVSHQLLAVCMRNSESHFRTMGSTTFFSSLNIYFMFTNLFDVGCGIRAPCSLWMKIEYIPYISIEEIKCYHRKQYENYTNGYNSLSFHVILMSP